MQKLVFALASWKRSKKRRKNWHLSAKMVVEDIGPHYPVFGTYHECQNCESQQKQGKVTRLCYGIINCKLFISHLVITYSNRKTLRLLIYNFIAFIWPMVLKCSATCCFSVFLFVLDDTFLSHMEIQTNSPFTPFHRMFSRGSG